MHALIVDDEPVARRVLREELELFDSIATIDEAENADVAFRKIKSTGPQLVFLDIQMPVTDGFGLIERLTSGHMPAIVMVTAYDEYAIRAFEAGAIDYLLKPVSHERLAQAIERAGKVARDPVRAAEGIATLQEMNPNGRVPQERVRKIVGKLGEEYFLLNAHEVFAFQAEGEVTWILTAKQRYTAAHNLKTIAERLRNTSFRRIHRNAVINTEQIRKMSMLTSQRWLLTLNNGQEFIVSKREARNVRDVLNW